MKNKFYAVLLTLFTAVYLFAQDPPPPGDGNVGTGGTGSTKPPTSIDMYVFGLIIVAILLVIYFAKKYRKQIA